MAVVPTSTHKVVYMASAGGNWDIYLVNADGSGQERLTTNPAKDGLPTWSPDGQAIAFVSIRDGAWQVHLMALSWERRTTPTNGWRSASVGPPDLDEFAAL